MYSMVMEPINGKMGKYMKVTGKEVRETAAVQTITVTTVSTKVNGRMIKGTGWEHIPVTTVTSTRENGDRI